MTTIPVPRETGRSGIMRAVTDLLTAERVWHMRCNVGSMRYGNNRLMRWGRLGMADLLALLRAKHGGQLEIEPVWIETKAPRGKQTPDQREFQREVEAEGHTYLLIRDAAELQAWLKRTQGMKQSGGHAKPEAAAQEPQCVCGHNEATHAVQVSTSGSRLHGCYVCSDCDHFVPATPAPSQPAGARECRCNCNPWCDCVCHEQKLAQQTAAKDAEIERLTAIAGDLTDCNDALTDESCKLQDDVAAIVSSHRSDWSWDDVLSDVRALKEWVPVSEAPRTGEHILVTALGKGGFGTCGGVVQDICAVVHWWDHPGEEGWYLSLGYDDGAQLWPTHFKALKAGKD